MGKTAGMGEAIESVEKSKKVKRMKGSDAHSI
jgi:hypothetical protein